MRVNNRGRRRAQPERRVAEGSISRRAIGTLTSITAYDHTRRAADRRPVRLPADPAVGAVQVLRQRIRRSTSSSTSTRGARSCASPRRSATSCATIVGAYYIKTDRFISTGNVFDLGTGIVPRVKRTPLPIFAPQFTYLADSQNNHAWAVFADATYRLHRATRRATSRCAMTGTIARTPRERPTQFIPAPLAGLAFPGQVRTKTWDDLQPKVTLRYPAQRRRGTCTAATAVASAAAGSTRRAWGPRASPASVTCSTRRPPTRSRSGSKGSSSTVASTPASACLSHEAKGSYYFVFDPNTSTQNLGNLGKVHYDGFGARALRASGGRVRHLRALRLHRQRDQGEQPRGHGRGQSGAARLPVHGEPRGAVPQAVRQLGLQRRDPAPTSSASAQPTGIRTISPSPARSTCMNLRLGVEQGAVVADGVGPQSVQRPTTTRNGHPGRSSSLIPGTAITLSSRRSRGCGA